VEALSAHLVAGVPPVLHVAGELDMTTADLLDAALRQALAFDPSVVVDMAEVTFVDAAGLRVILQAASSRNGAGPLTLVNAPRVAWLLKLVGLEGLPTIDVRGDGHAG
jgi:stage II sporulation protein AA (anti-sigma F factor antagonist)